MININGFFSIAVTVQESLLHGNIKALTESHSNVTDTYLRNLESSRMRHEVLTNDEINPFGDCKDKIEKLKDNSDGSDDDNDDNSDDSDDSDDDVIVL